MRRAGTHTLKDAIPHRLGGLIGSWHCVFDSRPFPSEDLLFCFAVSGVRSCTLTGGRVTRNAVPMCFYVDKRKLSAGSRGRLLGNAAEKHVCMSLCLHLELKIHEHRCFSLPCTHTYTHISLAVAADSSAKAYGGNTRPTTQ